MEKSPVEFIVEKLTPFNWTKEQMQEHYKDVIEQAKETQKLTIINTLVEFSKAHFDIHTEEAISYITDKAEQYYNETFKSE